MLVPGPPAGLTANLFTSGGLPLAEPLYWLRLLGVGPKRRLVARELRRLDPCLSRDLADGILAMVEARAAAAPTYIAGGLSAREAAEAVVRLSDAGARVVLEMPGLATDRGAAWTSAARRSGARRS